MRNIADYCNFMVQDFSALWILRFPADVGEPEAARCSGGVRTERRFILRRRALIHG